MTYIYWASIIFILYSYIGYPLLLGLLSLLITSKKTVIQGDSNNIRRKVSLLISAYNEESVIEAKILNSLALDYPRDLLEIVVVSDGSDDQTDKIVALYARENVILRRYGGRIGKTACLNRAVPLTKGDITIFSDANSQYSGNAIRQLTKHFEDDEIGFVSGTTMYVSGGDLGMADSVGLYTKLERLIKSLETKIGSCVGADGAIFAIRKDLYHELKEFDINDLVIPFNIIRQKFRGVFEGEATCVEETAETQKREFYRQARITNRTIRAIFNNTDLVNPFRFGLYSFQLFSHKICKLVIPYFMIMLLFSNILLAHDAKGYFLTLVGQLLIYGIAYLGHFRREVFGFSKIITICHSFVAVNTAILWGWIEYAKGETFTRWTTSR